MRTRKWKVGVQANDHKVYIGNSKFPYKPAEFFGFEGLIDEVMIYSRALSAREVHLLYSNTLQ